VRDVVKAYYDKKAGHLPQPSTADNLPPAGVVRPVGANTGAEQQ
jgi:hypothetical protein